MTGVSECSQQRGDLKDNGYIHFNNCFSRQRFSGFSCGDLFNY
ncbi:hypothetical protein [Photorhabdus laumondii]